MGLAIWMNDRPSLAPVAKSEPAPAAPPAGMVLVSEGEAALGPEGIRTQVAPYYIDKTEVTNAEWLKFCKATGRDCTGWAQADAALPVVNVSFDEATEYAAWAGKRLPSWIEWEKAARGADGRSFPWGNEFRYDAANLPKDREAAQTGRLGRADALPAGASLSGTLNQVGNAWEWVASTTVPSEARFADLGRIFASLSPPLARTEKFYQVRGGSFKSAFPKEALPQLLTDWTPMPGRGRRDDIGFRCVKDY
jgi:formylglycine-generating enzyme required for sulfatase activity